MSFFRKRQPGANAATVTVAHPSSQPLPQTREAQQKVMQPRCVLHDLQLYWNSDPTAGKPQLLRMFHLVLLHHRDLVQALQVLLCLCLASSLDHKTFHGQPVASLSHPRSSCPALAWPLRRSPLPRHSRGTVILYPLQQQRMESSIFLGVLCVNPYDQTFTSSRLEISLLPSYKPLAISRLHAWGMLVPLSAQSLSFGEATPSRTASLARARSKTMHSTFLTYVRPSTSLSSASYFL